MKGQPFVRYVGGLLVGILLYVNWPDWPLMPVIILAIGLLLFLAGWVQIKRQAIKPVQIRQGIGVLMILAAFGWVTTYLHTESNQPDTILYVADTLQAYEGVVVTQPEERAKTYRVELDLKRGKFKQFVTNTNPNRQVSWQPLSGRVIVYLDKASEAMPRYGEVWLVLGAPRPIDPPLNPGEFNYKQYLSYRNIYHQQYLRAYQRQIVGYDPPNSMMRFATVVNRWADSVLTRQVGTRAEYGIVNAMILGIRDDLDTEQYRAYSAAGAVHILSVSGLHVGILFNLLTLLLGFLVKHRRGKILMAGFQLLILWFYALVTGLSPPVLRSAAMFTMLIVATAFGRQQRLANTLGASAFFILCFDPYALFSAGFQLSNLAVAGIGAWQSSLYQTFTFRNRWANKLWEVTAVALVAQLITFPLGVFYFHQFPTYFLLANPAVMILSSLLLPLAMATLGFSWLPYVNDALGWVLQKIAWVLNWVVTQVGQLPGANWDGLWLTTEAMMLSYVIIFCGVGLLLTRNQSYLWVTCFAALGLAGLTIWEDFGQQHQQRLAVHFLPHRTAVSVTDGHSSTLLTDLDTTDTRSFEFYLKNTFGQWGVQQLTIANAKADSSSAIPNYYRTRDYALWVWQGRTLLLINKLNGHTHWRLPAVVDYLIIRRNAVLDWDQLTGRVVARHIIFDDSNKTPLTDKLLAEAKQRGIICYSVRQMGAYVAEL